MYSCATAVINLAPSVIRVNVWLVVQVPESPLSPL